MRWTSPFHGRTPIARRAATAIAAVLIMATLMLWSRADARPASPQGAPGLTDAAIVAIFDLANTADIETGALAAKRADAKDVREFGTMLSQVHTQVRKNGRELAKKLNVTPALPRDDGSAKQHAEVMARLRGLRGAEFDRAFLEHERAFHQAVLDAVKSTLLPAIQNAELKEFVTSLAPAFEAHRLAAENLQKKHS